MGTQPIPRTKSKAGISIQLQEQVVDYCVEIGLRFTILYLGRRGYVDCTFATAPFPTPVLVISHLPV